MFQNGRTGQGQGPLLPWLRPVSRPDYQLFLTLARGEWWISGFRARDLRRYIDGLSGSRASYLIKRLRTHGIIKKAANAYKYFFTKLGRRVVVASRVIREYFVQPTLVRDAL
jgi:hypothetical protein